MEKGARMKTSLPIKVALELIWQSIKALAQIATKPETAQTVVSGKFSVEYQKFISVIDGHFTVITLYCYIIAVVANNLTAYCIIRFI